MTDADSGSTGEQRAAGRGTAPVFVTYLVVIAVGIVAAFAVAFARHGDDAGARSAVERFSSAIRRHDGAAACSLLAAQTRTQLEEQEGSRCESAILELGLSGGQIDGVDVAETSARAEVAGDGGTFLDEEAEGWRITALGCRPLPDRPDDCEVDS